MRDGVNLSSVERNRPAVSPTDIQSLKNLHAYLKLPGTIPPVKIKFRYLKTHQIADAFAKDPTVLERKKEEIAKLRSEAEKKKEETNIPEEDCVGKNV